MEIVRTVRLPVQKGALRGLMRPLGETDRLTNMRYASTEVQFNDARQFDVRVWDRDDAEVWQ